MPRKMLTRDGGVENMVAGSGEKFSVGVEGFFSSPLYAVAKAMLSPDGSCVFVGMSVHRPPL